MHARFFCCAFLLSFFWRLSPQRRNTYATSFRCACVNARACFFCCVRPSSLLFFCVSVCVCAPVRVRLCMCVYVCVRSLGRSLHINSLIAIRTFVASRTVILAHQVCRCHSTPFVSARSLSLCNGRRWNPCMHGHSSSMVMRALHSRRHFKGNTCASVASVCGPTVRARPPRASACAPRSAWNLAWI